MVFLNQDQPSAVRPGQIGRVVKSNSHCDYVVELDTALGVNQPPEPEAYGFGQFVKLADRERLWAVGVIYNSLLVNPMFMSNGPRLTSDPDPLFTPDLINETRTLLGVVLVGTLTTTVPCHGIQGIPRVVVPVNTPVCTLSREELYSFHLTPQQRPQFSYYGHLLKFGGGFAAQLTQQVFSELAASGLFEGADQRALTMLCRELTWRNTISTMG